MFSVITIVAMASLLSILIGAEIAELGTIHAWDATTPLKQATATVTHVFGVLLTLTGAFILIATFVFSVTHILI